MIDIHIHVLPGVDDGARDLAEALEMCRLAALDGCDTLVSTPHQRQPRWSNTDRPRLEELRRELQERLGERPKVLAGGEIRIDDDLLEEVERIPGSGLLPLAGSRYLLLELGRDGTGPDPEHLVHELRLAGWRPILAHPEFIRPLAETPGRLERLTEMGALLQVTAGSLTGDFGRRARQTVERLLDADLVHFVASDAHGLDWRPPGLKRAFDLLAASRGLETARRLISDNPRAVLEDRPLPVPGPVAG